MKRYLAYGSNLNKRQMIMRCKDSVVLGSALLKDYELCFKGVATVLPKTGSFVPIGVYQISEEDEAALDRYEGISSGLYTKEYMKVELIETGEVVEGLIYILRPDMPDCTPSGYYVDTIAEGYKDFGFDLTPLQEACLKAFSKGEASLKGKRVKFRG